MAEMRQYIPPPRKRSEFEDGNTELHEWSSKGDYDRVLLLLLQGTNSNVCNIWKHTPLHLASSGGHLDVMLLLLDSGACVNARDHQSLTPLHHAVIHRNKKSVELLLSYGASPYNADDVTDTYSPFLLSESIPSCHMLIKDLAGLVPQLQHLCRLQIRKLMGVSRRKRMRELPVPPQIIAYLGCLPLTFSDELLNEWDRKRVGRAKKKHHIPSQKNVIQELRQGRHIL